MTGPLVSIISPTYNHEQFVAQCVESVLAQEYDHWEMVIVDDGSLDRTAEIVQAFTDPRIRFRTQEHRGIHGRAQTYNEALAQARGEFIRNHLQPYAHSDSLVGSGTESAGTTG